MKLSVKLFQEKRWFSFSLLLLIEILVVIPWISFYFHSVSLEEKWVFERNKKWAATVLASLDKESLTRTLSNVQSNSTEVFFSKELTAVRENLKQLSSDPSLFLLLYLIPSENPDAMMPIAANQEIKSLGVQLPASRIARAAWEKAPAIESELMKQNSEWIHSVYASSIQLDSQTNKKVTIALRMDTPFSKQRASIRLAQFRKICPLALGSMLVVAMLLILLGNFRKVEKMAAPLIQQLVKQPLTQWSVYP